MKKLILTVLLIVSYGSAFADISGLSYYDSDFSIQDRRILVSITDNAGSECWTNIGEVEEYIVNKLELAGAEVVQNLADAEYTFIFRVLANRLQGVEVCYGFFDFSLTALTFHDGFVHASHITQWDALDAEPKNFNNSILDWLNKRLSKLD